MARPATTATRVSGVNSCGGSAGEGGIGGEGRSDAGGGMKEHEFRRVAGAFRRFHRRFAPLFGRTEARRHGEQYVRGLLVQHAERRNAENLAEAVVGTEGRAARALQQFLTDSPWAHGAVVAELQRFLAERLPPHQAEAGAATDGVWTLDSTGFAKRGTRSAGVARQYSGALGKVDTCQIGVFLGYATARGHALVDGRPWLPRGAGARCPPTPRVPARGPGGRPLFSPRRPPPSRCGWRRPPRRVPARSS